MTSQKDVCVRAQGFIPFIFTAKFVVSRCAFCKLRRDFEFFCSVNQLSGCGAGCKSQRNFAAKPKLRMTLDCSLNSEGNRGGGWNVNLAREEGRLCFILASEVGIRTLERSEKSSKKTSRLLPKTGRSQATNLEIQTPPPLPHKKKRKKK